MTKIKDLLQYDFDEMQLEMERCSREGKGTPQEIADRREALVRTFFEKYYPFPYKITKGQICDSYGNESCSVDCVILNPIHPYTFDAKTHNVSVILADGVDFAIECKSNLNSELEIERVLKQCKSVKALRKVKTGVWGGEPKDFNYQLPFIIWANKTTYKIEELLDKITTFYEKENYTQENQFDMLVIDGKYIVYNVGINNLGGEKNFAHGFYYITCDKDTLTCLLWSMTNFIGAAPATKNILSNYTFIEKDVHHIADINNRLRNINDAKKV